MARVEVDNAFVERVVENQQHEPFVVVTSEPHRRKNGEVWETTARTFRDVKASRDSGVSLWGIAKGDRVSFVGTEKTEKRVTPEGDRYQLVVWVESLTVVGGGGARNGAVDASEPPHRYNEVTPPVSGPQTGVQRFDDSTPF